MTLTALASTLFPSGQVSCGGVLGDACAAARGSATNGWEAELSRVDGPHPDQRNENSLTQRLTQLLVELTQARLLLGSIVLAVLSLGVVLVAALQPPGRQDEQWVTIVSQVGTGMLVSAVGAALLQVLILRPRRELEKELHDMDRQRVADQLDRLTATVTEMRQAVQELENYVDDTRKTLQNGNVDALASADVSRVFRSRVEASKAMANSLTDGSTTEIRLMGISLGDLIHPGSLSSLAAGWSKVEGRLRDLNDNGGPLRVRILLPAPGSSGIRLFGVGAEQESAGSGDWHLPRVSGSLDQEIKAVAQHLLTLQTAVTQTPDKSFELRFYRSVPQFFLCATNNRTYVHPYYLPNGERVLDPIVMSFSAEAERHRAARRHFDVLWSHGSVPADDVMISSLPGIEPGMARSGATEVFVDPESVRKRIVELLRGARRRVWIQAMTLEAFRSSPIDREMVKIVQRDDLDVRLIVLDPVGESAFTKTFHEYLLSSGGTFKEYRRDKQAHRDTRMYRSIEASIVWFQQLAQKSSAGSLRFHKSNFSSNMFLLIIDDVAMVEQYHYGKAPGARPDAMVPMLLAEEMPTVEYHAPVTLLFNRKEAFDPLQVLEGHFIFVFDHLSVPVRQNPRT